MRQRIPVKRSIGWSTLALLLIAGVVHAAAPSDQYELFDASYDEIRDSHTMLAWERRPDQSQTRTFGGAEDYCLAKGTQWRLPTVKELLTIVDEERNGTYENGSIVYRAIDRNAFPNTEPQNFWTSSPVLASDDVWVVDFDYGETDSRNTTSDQAYVRCVRNWQ